MNCRILQLAATGALTLGLVACATTSFQSTWKAPDAQPLQFKKGDKVIAMVLAKSATLQRVGESKLADELDARGLVGVPSHMLIEDTTVDETTVKQAIDATGAVGIVVMRPMGSQQQLNVTNSSMYYGPGYNTFWGGYYHGGWGNAWGMQQVTIDTYVSIETLIYDLRQNKLVWAGQSQTLNPDKVDEMVSAIATAVSQELAKSGIAPAK